MSENKTPIRFLKTRETIAIAVAERYQADETFRDSFDRDPKTTLLKHFDMGQEDWPSGMELRILRNDDQCVHVGIPTPTPGAVKVPDSVLVNVTGGYG